MITKVYLKFDKLKAETNKAYLLQFGHDEYWLPKKLCWRFVLNKKLGGNCSIPTWLYEKIFGRSPEESEASEVVIKHVPTLITPQQIDPHADLVR